MPMKEHTPVEQMTHLTEKQKERVKHWISLQDTLNNGKFGEEMDAHIDTEKFTYGNPNRRIGRKRIGRINALFTQVQQLWTAVDSFDTPAMQPNPADGEPATLKIYPPLSH